jgi:hypothetical protein
MKAELLCLIDRFSSHKSTIQSLFDKNENFQALCREYFLCVQSLNQWSMSFEKKEKLIRQYSELKIALEKKLLHFFDKAE